MKTIEILTMMRILLNLIAGNTDFKVSNCGYVACGLEKNLMGELAATVPYVLNMLSEVDQATWELSLFSVVKTFP